MSGERISKGRIPNRSEAIEGTRLKYDIAKLANIGA